MATKHTRQGAFRRVGECLYRYSSNGAYYAVYRYLGKIIWKSLRTSDRELARRRLRDVLEKKGLQQDVPRKMTLAELLSGYEQQLPRFDEGTQANKLAILRKFRRTWDKGFDLQVAHITPADLQLWLNREEVLRNSNRKADSSSAKIGNWAYNQYVLFLRQLFALAVDARVISESPAAALRQLKPEKPLRLTPTTDQFRAIVASIRAQQFNPDAQDSADLVEFMGLAGLGTAECANLRGEHLDFASKRMTVYRRKTDTGFVVPMFPQVLPLLERLKEQGKLVNGQTVFAVKDPKKALTEACRRLGFPHFSPRSLRRFFITRGIELGIDFKTLAAWQGHQDGGVLIARTYSHLRSEHSDAMAQRLTMQASS